MVNAARSLRFFLLIVIFFTAGTGLWLMWQTAVSASSLTPNSDAPTQSGWIINEIHADPANDLTGDANGDGARDGSEDEFVEIINNTGGSVDISGWVISDAVSIRHTFPANTIIPDQCAVVVFGGGAPAGEFGHALIQTANSGQLGLNNTGDTLTFSSGSAVAATVSYDSAANHDEAITRAPDITGEFARHSSIPEANGALFSPGTRLDGASFSGCQQVDTPPTVSATNPISGATAVPLTQTITITFSEAVTVTEPWAALSCSNSGAHTTLISAEEDVYTLTPNDAFAPGESCTVIISAAQVIDQDIIDPPDEMLDNYGWSFETAVPPAAHILINEVDADTPGSDEAEFIELFDGGAGNTRLDGLVIVFFNGGSDAAYRALDLDGHTTDANGYFVLGNTAVSGVDLIFPDAGLQNGADAVALYLGDTTDFTNGTAVTTTNLLDALVYDTDDADDSGLLALLHAGEPQVNENEQNFKDGHSMQRCGGGQRETTDYITNAPTPKNGNACVLDLPPSVVTTTPESDSTAVAVDANLSITFNEDVSVSGEWFLIECNGISRRVGDTAVSGGPQTWQIDPVTDFGHAQSCTVIIYKDQVQDSDTIDPPDLMNADYSWQFTTAGIPPAAYILINEVDADTPGDDTAEFIELYDGGGGNTHLDGLVVVFFNGGSDASYRAIDLDGQATDANGYFVLGNTAVSGVDFIFPDAALQNGADAVALYAGNAADFPNGTAISSDNLLDALVYDTDDAAAAGLLPLLNPDQPQINENERGYKDLHSNQRCPNGGGGQRNTDGYLQNGTTPKATNNCVLDSAPQVIQVAPADQTVDVARDAGLTVQFNEAVNAAAGWFEIDCSSSGMRTEDNTAVSGGPTIWMLNPASDFLFGESCTTTILAQKIQDSDEHDPPDEMATDFAWSFTIESPPPARHMLINEVDVDTPGSDTAEFIELYDGGAGSTNLSGLVLVLFNGSDDSAYRAVDLNGYTTGGDGYFVIGNTAVPGVDLVIPNAALQNGPDAVALYAGSAADFPNGAVATIENLLDALVYDTDDADDAGLLVLLNPNQPQVNEDAADHKDEHANQRCPNGAGGQLNTAGYIQNPPTPGAANNCVTDQPPTVSATTPADGAAGVYPDANLSVTFSEDVTTAAGWITLNCSDSGAHPGAVSGGAQIFAFNPDMDFISGESCTALIDAALVSDQDGAADAMPADFSWQFNVGMPAFGACGGTSTPIHAIQGSGDISPLAGAQGVIIEGVVTGSFLGESALNGFFMQAETAVTDDDPQTSEGIFVYAPDLSETVNAGDVVRVQGDVAEYNGLTELNNIYALTICAQGTPIPTEVITLPVDSLADWERFESMHITLSQPVTASDNYWLGQYGQVDLAVNGRLYAPTAIKMPGVDANTQQNLNDRSHLILDDGSSAVTPLPLPPYLDSDNTLRAGDTLNNLTAIVMYSFDAYRLHPTQPVDFTRENGRSAAPPELNARLKVASFNLHNYFNGDGQGGGFPTARGAASAEEFTRQRAKIVAALLALDADVIGLMELENDGYGAASAIQDLVNGLNAAAPAGTSYGFIDPGLPQLGADEIAVGLVYRLETIAPEGTAVTLNTPPFDSLNRQPLAQTFRETATGESFTVVVNHFKSKAGCPTEGENSDQEDGQGCWNRARTSAAQALTVWLAAHPTGAADPDMLIIGDLNAYALEEPIAALESRGYQNLVADLIGSAAYTSVFDAQAGYLDHALANDNLARQVTDLAIWHINADEPRALDYRLTNQPDLYQPDPFRSSDHDPLLVGLNLASVQAGFSSNGPVQIGQDSAFTNASSGSGELQFAWDFGDGSDVSTAIHPLHRYGAVGSYLVTLKVTNEWGETAEYSSLHTVTPVRYYTPLLIRP